MQGCGVLLETGSTPIIHHLRFSTDLLTLVYLSHAFFVLLLHLVPEERLVRQGLPFCSLLYTSHYLKRPSHKLVCGESKAAAKFKFVSTLMGNVFIDVTLMEVFILTFGLHENMIVDRPLIVRCDLAIDAEDLPLIFRLASQKQTPEEFPDGVQGMLQIKSFTPLDPVVAMDAQRWRIWQQARKTKHPLDRTGTPVGKIATGLVDFHMEGTSQVLTLPLHIHSGAIESAAALSTGKDIVCPVAPFTGEKVHLNVTPMVLIGSVNFKR